jgi:hypothetical protein
MSKQLTRRPTKQDRRQERREELARREAERKRAARNRLITVFSILGGVVLLAGLITAYAFYVNGQGQTETIVNANYPPVDGIYCDQQEQLAFHIHAHLSIYIDGQPVQIPQNMGIASDNSCLYWLHTHDTSGVIHMEAPVNRTFTLGNFLDEWANQFSSLNYPSQLDLNGWTAYVDGKLYTGDFHKIPLGAHTLITLAYNTPNPKIDTTYNWNGL